MNRIVSLTSCCLCAVAVGCVPRELPPDDPAADCLVDVPADPSTLPTRTAEIGDVEGDTFMAWIADQSVPIDFGGQGFAMVTPFIEIPFVEGDVSGVCWEVVLEHLDETGAVSGEIGGFQSGLEFQRVGDAMRVGPIFDILDSQGEGDVLRLRVTVTAPDFFATDAVDIVLTLAG